MNEAQAKAAQADVNVPLLVVAGAGSGKTLTMVKLPFQEPARSFPELHSHLSFSWPTLDLS